MTRTFALVAVAGDSLGVCTRRGAPSTQRHFTGELRSPIELPSGLDNETQCAEIDEWSDNGREPDAATLRRGVSGASKRADLVVVTCTADEEILYFGANWQCESSDRRRRDLTLAPSRQSWNRRSHSRHVQGETSNNSSSERRAPRPWEGIETHVVARETRADGVHRHVSVRVQRTG